MARFYQVFLPYIVLLTAGCIPLSSIDGAPCPCPDGYICCSSSETCSPVSIGCAVTDPLSIETEDVDTKEEWLETSDTGSAIQVTQSELENNQGTDSDRDSGVKQNPYPDYPNCVTDDQCPSGELCQSWKDNEGYAHGPRYCRQTCNNNQSCGTSESCELSLHGGTLLNSDNNQRAYLCLPPDTFETCQESRCSLCPTNKIDTLFCQDGDLYACYPYEDRLCGLSCIPKFVQSCIAENCTDDGSLAYCGHSYSGLAGLLQEDAANDTWPGIRVDSPDAGPRTGNPDVQPHCEENTVVDNLRLPIDIDGGPDIVLEEAFERECPPGYVCREENGPDCFKDDSDTDSNP